MLLWQKVLVLQSPRSDTRSLLRWQSRQKANIQAQIIPQSIIWAYSTSSRETFLEKGNTKLPSLHSSPSSKSGLHPKRAPPKEPTNTGQKLSGPANLGVDAVLLRIDQNKIHNYNAYGNIIKYQSAIFFGISYSYILNMYKSYTDYISYRPWNIYHTCMRTVLLQHLAGG